jgi:hypothetical protein
MGELDDVGIPACTQNYIMGIIIKYNQDKSFILIHKRGFDLPR